MELNDKIIPVGEVTGDLKICKYCGKQLDLAMSFCTRCGKMQGENPENEKKVKRVVKKSRKKKIGLSKILSFVSFGISFFIMFYAVIRMFMYNAPVISIFGSSNDAIIINQTYVLGSLIISLMFLLLGMFLYKIND